MYDSLAASVAFYVISPCFHGFHQKDSPAEKCSVAKDFEVNRCNEVQFLRN